MHFTKALRAGQRTPLIKFLGKRGPPAQVDHTPHAHPAAPSDSLPDSFALYRSKAQQHGPLAGQASKTQFSAAMASISLGSYGALGSQTGRSLGRVEADNGQYFDRSELPKKFGRTPWTLEEIEAVETGGASMW